MSQKAKFRQRTVAQVRQAERERIARDMHDTLLQGAQALLFRLQVWEEHPAIPESLRSELAAVILHTKSIVLESRERILMMRRAPPDDIHEALAAIGQEASAGKSATFNLSVTGEARPVAADANDQLIHIAREAVRNAYQHANASHIAVTLQYCRWSLLMCITDDGRGINPAFVAGTSSSIHFGLIGMRERTIQLGARFRVYSRPGAGTRIEVRVPAGGAFENAFRWPWQHKVASWARSRGTHDFGRA